MKDDQPLTPRIHEKRFSAAPRGPDVLKSPGQVQRPLAELIHKIRAAFFERSLGSDRPGLGLAEVRGTGDEQNRCSLVENPYVFGELFAGAVGQEIIHQYQ